MWKLSEITIRNIVSFHEASLKITHGVATLIFGKNEDNASQPCNGSGKSSLIEAISFALTGEQLRKVKSVDEIINDLAEEAYVNIELSNDADGSVFTISRTISRNAPQVVECHKYNEAGEEIETDKTIQPTVLDYNRFILNEIGLSKDDIYNNYILCDNKYESFFDCSDKNKKEIINRFSNGAIVDDSIARLQSDMEPVAAELTSANNEVVRIKGAISAIETELDNVDEKKLNARQNKLNRITKIEDAIYKCRCDIDANEEKRDRAKERLTLLKKLQADITTMEASDTSMLDAYKQIKGMCDEYDLKQISDYHALSNQYEAQLEEQRHSLDTLSEKQTSVNNMIAERKVVLDNLSEQYRVHIEQEQNLLKVDKVLVDKINKELDKIDIQLDEIEKSMKENKARQGELEVLISQNTALLKGAVTCPKCHHQFFADGQDNVEEVRRTLVSLTDELKQNKASINKLQQDFDKKDKEGCKKEDKINEISQNAKQRASELEKEHASVKKLSDELDDLAQNAAKLRTQQISVQNELDRIGGHIEVLRTRLFGEIAGVLEGHIMTGQNFIGQQDSSIEYVKGQLVQYQKDKKELEEAPDVDFAASLNASMKKYKEELETAEEKVSEITAEYNKLKEQEVNFTMFKSYIARKKIDALSLIVNDFLEKIGSDIRLKLEGFSVTKTGKLRDKISVQVMRDGIDCGSYHKFSGGEKARLNLACILSLHTLTNSNCEYGKGLDFIIIDELLDKSDEAGMATYCDALNKLGQTALLITQGGVSESYPYKLLVVKKQGVSTIQN